MNYIKPLYVQVLLGILLGIILGLYLPDAASSLKPLSDAFIKLIKMLITPIIFLSLVSGIAAMNNLETVGKVGGAALLYFIVTTAFALLMGLIVGNLVEPGAGLHIDPATLDIKTAQPYLGKSTTAATPTEFLLNIIPETFFSAFVEGEILQVLLVAILFAIGLMYAGKEGKLIVEGVQVLARIFFKMIHLVMHLAPMAAFAAMAFTVGQYGLKPLLNMLELLLCFYVTAFGFVVGILGIILKLYCQINVFTLLAYIKTELLIVLGTSSSETVLPNLLEKLEKLGCQKSTVGLVLPLGYSFNLDGTAIYLTLAALFIAQATNTDLTFWQQLSLLAVMIVSSKGAAGVAGSGFIVLASSLAAVGHVPVAGIVLLLGIDRFMSDGRALTNMIGNSISTIIISKWQGVFDQQRAQEILGSAKIQEDIQSSME
ncbi:C4-dicarboxylate transporter DctA [Legionella erythra]|uniref:C4-dicarboxylic acid, orotate and citrate transporter n=1 Tax=Legionella erythra TaxID=448 RepID=A0A0W0TX74_LEGER|nr:C4-dicarboxylate transporter DctA [Legionella erythra]KTD00007.1 C4-dicarboxylic acid, orotate and citrate transporter [Legionella erythra]